MEQVVDMVAVREIRTRLDEIAAEHPEAFQGRSINGWRGILEQLESDDMAKKTKLMLRLDQEMIDRLDDHVERLRRLHPGLDVTRSSAIRNMLHSGLERAEGKSEGA